MKANLTQAELAKRVNDKASAIVELENGSAQYNADLVNRIEKVLNVQIPRGRKSNNKKKKWIQMSYIIYIIQWIWIMIHASLNIIWMPLSVSTSPEI